jgi:hypothetical protein
MDLTSAPGETLLTNLPIPSQTTLTHQTRLPLVTMGNGLRIRIQARLRV